MSIISNEEIKLIENKEYFDNMFKEVDKNIILDDDQRRIIINDDQHVNYLIERKNIKDNEIIVISFTNKATKELQNRINNDFKHNVKITTFHKFGYEIIKDNKKIQPKIIKENKIINEYIKNKIIYDKKNLKRFIDLYTYYFEISEEILVLGYDKYIKYKNNQKYPTLKSKIEYIKDELVNTIPEKTIANFLYIQNIEYKYKEKYKYLENYIPDFTIYYENKIYYIEIINIESIKKFNNQINILKLRKIHKKYGTNMIEIYSDNIIEQLKEELKKRKIKLETIPNEELFNKIISNKDDKAYIKFVDFCTRYISLCKSKGYTNKLPELKYKSKRNQIFKEFIEKLYDYYQKELKKQNLIDFDDMINEATKIIQTKKEININYKYIIIDEYQDISECRLKLIEAIIEKIKSKIIVVGDDWQCIYGFTASNINLFLDFINEKCTIKKITNTYRNSQELIDIAGQFIQKNQKQIKKN